MAKPIIYPTEGGSYVVKKSGDLDQVAATKPAPPPDPGKPDEQPAAPPPAPATEKE